MGFVTSRIFALVGIATVTTLIACGGTGDDAARTARPATEATPATGRSETTPKPTEAAAPTRATAKVTRAQAILAPVGDSAARGKVEFLALPEGVQIEARVSGLGKLLHGFHIHEVGDCSAADASSAGGHYNPGNSRHGSPLAESAGRHSGDLGNLAADPQSGEAHYVRVDKMIALDGDGSIIGRAVVVHAGEDDFQTQPSGDAGARIACGVITAAGDG